MNPITDSTEVCLGAVMDSHYLVRHIAQQPILDVKGNLFAYELLFRSGQENRFDFDTDQATRIMFDNTLFFGLE